MVGRHFAAALSLMHSSKEIQIGCSKSRKNLKPTKYGRVTVRAEETKK